MKKLMAVCLLVVLSASCTVKPGAYSSSSVPLPPDYSKPECWAALPEQNDPADRTPEPAFQDLQHASEADVFFLHPTTFTGKMNGWNASIGDAKLNQKTDQTTILYQASIFNAAGRVFAPRYRQAHLQAFFTKDSTAANQAFDLAYQDLKAAFEFYLQHYNQGRPILIAAHSQGAKHGIRLLRDFFDAKPLGKRLVAAYLVGWPVEQTDFKTIPPCQSPKQTGCVCSWRSYRYGHMPEGFPTGDQFIVTNPLTWTTEKTPAPKSLNEGSVLRKFDRVFPQIADAQVHLGLLWVHKPKFPGSIFFSRKNYHIADFNFFYVNVRNNAQERVRAFFK